MSRGPGDMFRAMSAPSSIAVVPDPGIPSVRSGTNDPVHAALFAHSGAASPFTDPFPNFFCSFSVAIFRSTAYPRKLAIVAPAPGSTPIRNPCTDCRAITGVISLASCLVILSLSILFFPLFMFDRFGSSTRNIASGSANIAIASVMNPNPDCRSMIPIVNRCELNSAPSPTVASMSPVIVMSIVLATCPVPANAAIADSPTTISAKYSAEWNSRATLASAGANIISSIAPIVPPQNDAIAAIVSALPAFPSRASGYPSKLVATVDATPGALIRIEDVDPPNIAP